jgi:hypothetical protein
MGFLMFKYVLNNQDNEEILSLINIEKLLDYDVEDTLKKSFLESEEKLDLTYFISTLLPYINASIKEIGLQFDEIDTLAIEDEQKHYDEEIIIPKEEKTNNIFVNNQEENKLVDGLSYEKKVALPTLIVGLDEKDASTVAQHLVELYPTLKRNQAEFFARHCTLGKYYTISQYKRDCSCAYETARTSMDNLVALGFYKKELIKNKFVYTPLITSKEENYD